MRVPFFHNLLLVSTVTLLSLLAVIVIPGFFIWVGFRALGRDVGFLRCVLSNIAASIIAWIAMILTAATIFAPLSPITALVAYFYALKVLLNVSFIEAIAATVIAGIVAAVILFALLLIGIALLPPTVPMPRYFVHF